MGKNEDLQRLVQDAIELEPFLNATEVNVIAKEGTITLSGMVDTIAKKIKAEEVAKKVIGVNSIVMKIEMSPAGISNEIASEVIDVLKQTMESPDEKIKVTVEVGKSVLEGELQWHCQKDATKKTANKIVEKPPKINNIENKPQRDDEIEKEQIEYELARNWSIDDENIQVKISENRVTLKGTVHSVYQKEEAERIVSNIQGVHRVHNELLVEYK